MELQNLKINFLGDSITAGWGSTNRFEDSFIPLLSKKYPTLTCRNYGLGGTRIARQHTPSENPQCDMDFCSRFVEMDEDADVVVVFGGTNDFGHGDASFGTMADRTPDTFYGAMHFLCRGLIAKYPKADIVFMTPLHASYERKNKRGFALKQYVDIIREVCEYYSLPVLDLWANSGIALHVSPQKELYSKDGLHPNDAGYARLCRRVEAFLKAL